MAFSVSLEASWAKNGNARKSVVKQAAIRFM
jgi:hypothetical protein